MRLGLISDSHDNLPLVDVARRVFRDAGCDRVLHLGDITTPEVVRRLADLPIAFLRGNNDLDPVLDATLRELGLPPLQDVWTGSLAGVPAIALHGHRKPQLARHVGSTPLVLHGHTHARRAERVGDSLVVNPGALFRVRTRTVALLEAPGLAVRFHALDEDGARPLPAPGERSSRA